jgi:hypothetical protein
MAAERRLFKYLTNLQMSKTGYHLKVNLMVVFYDAARDYIFVAQAAAVEHGNQATPVSRGAPQSNKSLVERTANSIPYPNILPDVK